MSRMSSMPAGVEAVHGLVEDEQLGVPEQAGGDAQTLAHAHGVLRHLVVGPMQDADALERRVDAALGRRLTRRGEDLQVLAAGQVAVEAGLVDDGPDPGQGHVTVSGDGVAEKGHRAGVGVGQSQQHPDQRGLAGAVRAEVAEGAAAGDEELDVVDGDVLAESLGQPVGLDGPLARRRRPPAASWPMLQCSCSDLHFLADGAHPVSRYTRYSTDEIAVAAMGALTRLLLGPAPVPGGQPAVWAVGGQFASAPTTWVMQPHNDAMSSGSMAGNMAMRSWLRPSLRYGSVSTIPFARSTAATGRRVDGVDEVDGAHDVAAIGRVLDEGPGEAGLLGPGVEDLGRAVAARRRPLQAAVGVHPVELLGQQEDGGQRRRVVGLVEHASCRPPS